MSILTQGVGPNGAIAAYGFGRVKSGIDKVIKTIQLSCMIIRTMEYVIEC